MSIMIPRLPIEMSNQVVSLLCHRVVSCERLAYHMCVLCMVICATGMCHVASIHDYYGIGVLDDESDV